MEAKQEEYRLRAKGYLLTPCATCGKKQFIAFHKYLFVMEEPKVACSETCLKEYEDSIEAWLERHSLT